MIYLQAIGIGLLIFGVPSLVLVGMYVLIEHVSRVREDRRSLRELREWRHAQREMQRALSTWG